MNPRLTLGEADRATLAGYGIAADRDTGLLSTSTGEPVDAGTAVNLLTRAREGQHPQAGQEPAGQPAGADLEAMLNSVPRADMAAKALDPDSFRREYLMRGHSADSPANTGGWEYPVPLPESDPAEPEDFARGWLRDHHQEPSPDDDPHGNNPCPPGTPGCRVYTALTGQWRANEAKARTEHMEPATTMGSSPAPSRAVLSPDMRARSVPERVSAGLTRAAPGEER